MLAVDELAVPLPSSECVCLLRLKLHYFLLNELSKVCHEMNGGEETLVYLH